jgi:hypothetical protein
VTGLTLGTAGSGLLTHAEKLCRVCGNLLRHLALLSLHTLPAFLPLLLPGIFVPDITDPRPLSVHKALSSSVQERTAKQTEKPPVVLLCVGRWPCAAGHTNALSLLSPPTTSSQLPPLPSWHWERIRKIPVASAAESGRSSVGKDIC